MSKEKQIEEMGKVLCGMKNGCDRCMWDKVHCNERSYAEEIYNAGYRKQSEVIDDLDDLLIDFDEMGFCPTTLVPNPEGYAIEWKRKLVNALQGYRKQSEGEWVKTQFVARTGFYTIKEFPCNQCGEKFEVAKGNELMHFCPNCGAKMKGGAE